VDKSGSLAIRDKLSAAAERRAFVGGGSRCGMPGLRDKLSAVAERRAFVGGGSHCGELG